MKESRKFPGAALWQIMATLSLATLLASGQDEVSFNQQIRPILSDRCFNCHGPDEEGRKAKLRLDTEAGSRKALDDGWQVVTPGDPDRSELVRRVFAEDPDDVMPPPESNLVLTDAEKQALRRWVEQGAGYQGHWAFEPVSARVDVPDSDLENPIDAFVAAGLAKRHLTFAPEADRATLIRRASFGLTGLPPSPAEMEAFVNDRSDNAYEKLVDRLLASPHYGEQRALDWLDLARYADTFGYQADVEMDNSPWRDWVIRAFNENLPYDDFALWQVAGDLLDNPTREQRLATAFNRLHRQTNEGGSIDEEFRVEYVSDRVHTFGTAFLGLTMECARCHDHKYDPILQKDYYALSAFFNNIDESGLYSHFTRAIPNPTLLLYRDAEQERKHLELKNTINGKQADLDQWKPADVVPVPSTSRSPERKPVAAFAFDELDGRRSPNLVATNHAAEFTDVPALGDGHSGMAARFTGDNELVCNQVGEFTRADEFSISLWLKRTEEQERAIILHFSRAWSDSGSRGYELVLHDGRPFFGLIHFWPGNAIGIRGEDPLPLNEWTHITLTYDGSSRAAGLGIFVNGKRATTEVVRDHLFKDILHRREWGDSDVGNIHLKLGGRFRDSGFRNGLVDELMVFDRDLSRVTLMENPEYVFVKSGLEVLRRMENALVNDIPEIMVMEDMPGRRETYLLRRGRYDMRADPVGPDALPGIFELDPSLPRNRLALAKWLINRKNPLASRVAVNRAWYQHFGRGLVNTLEDFGSQGARPTHPALLDWMSAWFMDNGWDLKALHRLIVTSRTYRQQSMTDADVMANDPNNDWLARGPSHRLPGELVRDQALAASGLLVERIGGRSVKPYQPAGLWKESGTGKTYHQGQGEDLYRRSLYTFWRRTAPPPTMITFDATSKEVCTAKREVTSTPLQSLVLMNDPTFLEASRVLADQLWAGGGSPADMIRSVFVRIIGRQPEAAELELMEDLLRGQQSHFAAHSELTEKVLSIGDSPAPASEPAHVAALAMVINTLMNYDEFVMKR